jgi:formin-binding protein 1
VEREYAGKLQALAKKMSDKKSKIDAVFVLGSDPTKNWDENTLKKRSFACIYFVKTGDIYPCN